MGKRANKIKPSSFNLRSVEFPGTGMMKVTGRSGKVYDVKNCGTQWFIMNLKWHKELFNSIEALKFISQNEPGRR